MSYSISYNGVYLICSFEGFVSKPYFDQVGIPTIGYGSTFYPDGRKVTMQDKPVTKEEAIHLMKFYIDTIALPVLNYVKVPLNQNQVDSLLSFIYNVGAAGFKSSTLLKRINASAPCDEIQLQFGRWIRARGKVLPGLIARRKKEALLFCK
jgi:lysozyme